METWLKVISILGTALVILAPLVIFIKIQKLDLKFNFLAYLALAILISAILIAGLAWWSHTKSHILLTHYSYDFDAMNESERFIDVSIEHLERVKELDAQRTGVGWPMKAMMFFIVYLPYIFMVYLVGILIQWFARRRAPPETSRRF